MKIQDLIRQRKDIEFASDLSFGKIAAYKTGSVSVGGRASNIDDVSALFSVAHGITGVTGVPLMIGWVEVSNVAPGQWFPIWAALQVPGLGIEMQSSTSATHGNILVSNEGAAPNGGYNCNFKLWFYYV